MKRDLDLTGNPDIRLDGDGIRCRRHGTGITRDDNVSLAIAWDSLVHE